MPKLIALLGAFILLVSFYPHHNGFLHAQIVNEDTALVSWTPPTENTDGSTLTDLSHYYIYYGVGTEDPEQFTEQVEVGGNLTSFLISGLGPGTWCFAMTAVNSSAMESEFSNVACKTIEDFVPEPTVPKAPGGLAVQ